MKEKNNSVKLKNIKNNTIINLLDNETWKKHSRL